LIKQHFFTY
jgi:hypothetical protein